MEDSARPVHDAVAAPLEAVFYQILAVERIRGTLTREEQDRRLAAPGEDLSRLLGAAPLPRLLEAIARTRDGDLACCILRSLLSIHDGGDALTYLRGRATGLARPFGAGVSDALLSVATAATAAEPLRILIYESLASRLAYDAATFARLRDAAGGEMTEPARGEAFKALAECRGVPANEIDAGLLGLARTLLASGGEDVRSAAASLLQHDATAVETLASAVSGDGSAGVRAAALQSLIRLGLSGALTSESRERVAWSLCASVEDPDAQVACAAVAEVGRLVTGAVAPQAWRMLQEIFAKGRGTALLESAAESSYRMAASGFFKEQIRSRLLQYARDESLPRSVRTACASRADTLQGAE